MAIRLLSVMMMVASTAAASGVAAVAKAHEICGGSAMGPVLHALDAHGIAYKRTILMAIASPADKVDTKSV